MYMKKLAILFLVGLVAGALLGWYVGYDIGYERGVKSLGLTNVQSFDDCADKGYPVAESYPRVCFTPDGRSFTEAIRR